MLDKLYSEEHLEKYLKFEDNLRDFISKIASFKNNIKLKQIVSFRKLKPIPTNVIDLFYNKPSQFFSQYNRLLNNTTFIDYSGISIFAHYFYILYEKFKNSNKRVDINYEIYESNFNSFFKNNEKYFLVHDINLDTPLHKLVKFIDKTFFFEIYKKLKSIDLIGNEVLLTSNIDDKSVFSIIIDDIKYNSDKIKNYELYYNFLNENKALHASLQSEDKIIIEKFMSKIIFETIQYKEENFNQIFNNFNEFVKNNLKLSIYKYIYFQFASNINYLNCLFGICSKQEDYDNLLNLVTLLSTKKATFQKIYITGLCFVDHIGYVLRRMNSYKRKGELEINYALKFIKQIIPKIYKKDKYMEFFVKGKRFKKGLLNYVENNFNIDFDKKNTFLDLFAEMTNGKIYKHIEKNLLSVYCYYKSCLNKLSAIKINKNLSNELIENFLKNNIFIRKLIKVELKYKKINDGNEFQNYLKFLKEFINKNKCNILKYKYDLSDENIEKILESLIRYEIKNSKPCEIPEEYEQLYKKMEKEYIISREGLTNIVLNNYLKGKIPSNYFDLLFSFPQDLSKNIYESTNLSKIMNIKNYDTSEENYYKFIKEMKSLHNQFPLLKGKPYEAEYLALFILVSESLNDNSILIKNQANIFTTRLKIINNRNFIKLIKNINGGLDDTDLVKFINRYILVFCKLFKGYKNIFVGIMKELDQNFNFNLYSKVINIVEKYYSQIKTSNNEKDEVYKQAINEFLFVMILFYIKKKYENKYPNLVVFLLTYIVNLNYEEIIKLFNDAFTSNNFTNIFDNFIFEEFSFNTEKYKAIDYLNKNQIIILNNINILKKANYINYFGYLNFIKSKLNGYIYYQVNNELKYNHFKEYKNKTIKLMLLFHLDLTKKNNAKINEDEKNEDDNYILIWREIAKNRLSLFSFLDDLPKLINKNIFPKIISIIKDLLKDSNKLEEDLSFEYWKKDNINDNIITNLYEFLSFSKSEKNILLNLSTEYSVFFKMVNNFFNSIIDYLNKNLCLSIEAKKIDFIKNEISEFLKKDKEYYYKSYFLSQKSIVIDFTDTFMNKIKKLKDINSIKKEYNDFKSKISAYESEFHTTFYSQSIQILVILIQKNKDIFFDYLLFIKDNFSQKLNLVDINVKLMSNCLEEYVNCFPQIVSDCSGPALHGINIYLIQYIINTKKYGLFNHQNIKGIDILNNLDSCLLLFNNLNKEGSKYLLEKIIKNLCNDENELFVEYIKKAIINKYIFDIITQNIFKKKDKNFFDANKKIIIKALYIYSEKNGYYEIDQLFKYINNFISLEDIQNFVFPLDSENSIPYFLDEHLISDLKIDQENEKAKYLFFYASSSGKGNPNYETIAVILNYCQKERAILELFPSLYYKFIDFSTMTYITYFSNSRNKDTIKSLNNFFYNLLMFLEFIYKHGDYIDSLVGIEKDIFYYYIKIIILEITPPKLLNKYIPKDNNYKLNNIIDQMNEKFGKKNIGTEMELFIIFTLYEIKGTTLIPVKKYLPEFFSKIDNYCKTFKNLKIPEICLKNSLDIKFYDNFIYTLKNNREELIEILYDSYNLIFIIEKEYGNILDIEGKDLYFQKALYNLIKNDRIMTFIDNNKDSEDFFTALKNFDIVNYFGKINNETNIQYKFATYLLFSLKDFNRSSSIIIQKCIDDFEKLENIKINKSDYDDEYLFIRDKKKLILERKENSYDYFRYYIYYLEALTSITSYIILNSKNYFEKDRNNKDNKNNNQIEKNEIFVLKDILFQNDKSKFNTLKNSININQIKYYILEGFKKFYVDDKIGYDLGVKWIDYYLKKKNISQFLNDNNNMTFLKYINYLNIYCKVIINWLKKMRNIFEFYLYDYEINFIEEFQKEKAEKNFGQSLYNMAEEYINYSKKIKDGINKDYYDFKAKINMFYNFDDNYGDYIETSSGNELFYFIEHKIKDLDILFYKGYFESKKEFAKEHEFLFFNWSIENKDIKHLFCKLLDFSDDISKDTDYFLKNILPVFEKFAEKNNNFIPIYLQKNASKIEYLYDPYFSNNKNPLNDLIITKLKIFFNNYIFPSFYLNNNLYYNNECSLRFYNIFKINENYKQYVDFSNLIIDIFNSKFHKDNNLDELFKIRAINYILNNDSLLRIFIEEIYTSIGYKLYSKGNRNPKIKTTFTINIVKGNKISKSDFNKLKNKEDENIQNNILINSKPKNKRKKKKIVYKLKTADKKEKNINNLVHFAVFKKNLFKRDNIPNIRYSGHIPALQYSLELSKSKIMNLAFGNEFMLVKNQNQNLFFPDKETIQQKHGKKIKEPSKETFVNVFDLIYTVKNIGKNEIILYRNDISTVLDQYSEPSVFESLLNHHFSPKKDEDVTIDFDMIIKYVNDNF